MPHLKKLLHCSIAQLLKSNKTISERERAITIEQFNNGFTLIELLIVITIIGILASLTLASYGGAQAKARDGVRKSDLAQVKRALELAKADCEGSAWYPYIGASGFITVAQDNYLTTAGTAGLAVYLSNTNLKYISSVIKDPKNEAITNLRYSYYTGSTTTNKCPDTTGGFTQGGVSDYALATLLERTTDKDAVDSRAKCTGKPGISIWNAAGYYVICNN